VVGLAGGADQPTETKRLDVVKRYASLHSGPDTTLDRISRLAARIFDTPIGVVSFVGDDEIWFKGRHGLTSDVIESRPGLCATAAFRNGSYVLIDASADPWASRHPMVTGDPGVRFYAAAPIITADGFRLGTVAVMDTEPRRTTARELAILHDLAGLVADDLELRHAAVAVIEVEQEARSRLLAEAERVGHIAHTLHGSLMPSRLPTIPGLDVTAYYQPFSTDELGGDFFDVFPIADDRWGIFVGDVVGKGVEAAAFIALARYSLRAAALVEDDPGRVLSAVNEAMILDPASGENIYCTIAYGEFTPGGEGGWQATFTVGGHPPPLLLRRGGKVEYIQGEGTIIGTFGSQDYASIPVLLAPGDTVLLYSDGMTDLPTEGGWLGIEGLAEALENRPVASAGEAIELLRDVIAANDQPLRDDLVIVAVNIPTSPSPEGTVTLIDTSIRTGTR
jgi:phosphoserine phosphatase RsbU/P